MNEHDLTTYDVLVIGAGAAGLCAALFSAREGARTALLEGGRRAGVKILASGGGRCNVLPSEVSATDFFSHGSDKPGRNILRSWPLREVHAFFEGDLRVPLKLEASGKVFPQSDSARDVRDALVRACRQASVDIRLDHRVHQVQRLTRDGLWQVRVKDEPSLRARRLVFATGGLSLPKSGSDGLGAQVLVGLGHSLTRRYPALVPLTWSEVELRALAGVSLTATLEARDDDMRLIARERGDVLLTHKGLSGPATLQISRHFADPQSGVTKLLVRWGDGAWADLLTPGSRAVNAVLRSELPNRLAQALCERAGIEGQLRCDQLSKGQRKALLTELERCALSWTGTEGYKTAEVTAGGVPMVEVELKGLESKLCPGVHLCGEVLDVTGRLGGYNFLWAWVSGRVAGRGAASRTRA